MGNLTRTVLFSVLAGLTLMLSCGGPKVVERPPPVPQPLEPAPAEPAGEVSPVRVLILDAQKSVRVRSARAISIGDGEQMGDGGRLQDGGDFSVRCGGGLVRLVRGGRVVSEASVLSIAPAEEGRIYINGKPYRGGFVFRPVHGKVITINVLDIDDYIKGVLPAEIGYLQTSQFEAYRVQAVASRSYALSKLEEKSGEIYDLKATIMDQVYRGVQGESPEASKAVDGTRGLLAVWNGRPARTYYCACCGGHTSDIEISWPWKTSHPYLRGVRDSGEGTKGTSFCRRSPHFRWRVHWSGKTLERILKETLPAELGIKRSAVGALLDIEALDTAPDGRITAVEIETSRGTYRISGDRIRWVLRPSEDSDSILKSTLFKMSVKRGRGRILSVNLVGGGNGHGVGMCQAGAIRMAELGYSAEEILLHYYPGVTIRRLY